MNDLLRPLLACLALAIPGFAQADDVSEAQDIAQRLLARYESLRAYRDTSTGEGPFMGLRVRGNARTAYVAPDAVLVVVEAGPTRAIYQADGDRYRRWFRGKGWTEEPNAIGFFAGMTGGTVLSGEAAVRILSIYFPDDSYRTPLRELLGNSRRLPDQSTDGVKCHRLEVTDGKRRLEFWIGERDLLIRRIDMTDDHGEHTTRIKPEAEPALTKEDLEKEAQRLSRR